MVDVVKTLDPNRLHKTYWMGETVGAGSIELVAKTPECLVIEGEIRRTFGDRDWVLETRTTPDGIQTFALLLDGHTLAFEVVENNGWENRASDIGDQLLESDKRWYRRQAEKAAALENAWT